MNLSVLLYTHTDCKDIWPLFFGQTKKYLANLQKIIFVNKAIPEIDEQYQIITYDDSLQYTDRVINSLKQIDQNKNILFIHEDMLIYRQPKIDIIAEFVELIENKKASFIRLNKSSEGKYFVSSFLHTNLLLGDIDNLFCIQPTLCKVKTLLKVFSLVPNCNIWNFESLISPLCIKNNITQSFMTTDNNENKRGLYHWDSNIFPYVATAVEKGKWNFKEYNLELSKLLHDYHIDRNIRGIKE